MCADSELARALSTISNVLREDHPLPVPSRPKLKKKQYIQNLMFRLRRICNHPLLYKGYYTSKQIEVCRIS